MKRCPNCDAPNPERLTDCHYCGTSLALPKPVAVQRTSSPPRCPQCQTELASAAQFCHKCGCSLASQDTPLPPAVVSGAGADDRPSAQSVSPSSFPLNCVVCGSSEYWKVSAIVQSGVWGTTTGGNSVGVGYGADGSSAMVVGGYTGYSVSATKLAYMLAPPAQSALLTDDWPIESRLTYASFMVAVFAFIIGTTVPDNMRGSFNIVAVIALIAGCVFGAATRAYYKHKAKFGPTLKRRWMRAMQEWNSLFYCPRCDHVYNPQTGQSAPSANMNALLAAACDGIN